MREIPVSFWSDETLSEVHSVVVVIPHTWKVMMYLGALHLSVTNYSLLSVMTVSYQGQDRISINYLHLIFNEMAGTMRMELWKRSVSLGAQGGVHNNE